MMKVLQDSYFYDRILLLNSEFYSQLLYVLQMSEFWHMWQEFAFLPEY